MHFSLLTIHYENTLHSNCMYMYVYSTQFKLLFLYYPQGQAPFAVVATSGTTVLAAFDPLEPLADICQKHGLWLHVDVSCALAV